MLSLTKQAKTKELREFYLWMDFGLLELTICFPILISGYMFQSLILCSIILFLVRLLSFLSSSQFVNQFNLLTLIGMPNPLVCLLP